MVLAICTMTVYGVVGYLWTEFFENEIECTKYTHLIGVVGMIAVYLTMRLAVVWWRKRRSKRKIALSLPEIRMDDRTSISPSVGRSDLPDLPNEFKWSKEQITLCRKIGQGRYGTVMKAQLADRGDGSPETVVVRVVKASHGEKVFRATVAMVQQMARAGQHLNLVNMLGAVTKNLRNNELLVVLEHAEHGNLLKFLRRNARNFIQRCEIEHLDERAATDKRASSAEPNQLIRHVDLLSWGAQIARGMQFLAACGVHHGHLALQNILLCDAKVVKITKIGLLHAVDSGNNYLNVGEDITPYKWMAPECFSERTINVNTDIWSFGVLLWELYSLGDAPYQNVPNKDLYRKLLEGYRMERPTYACSEVYDVMQMCWYVSPYLRPSFDKLADDFGALLPLETRNLLTALNLPYVRRNSQREQQAIDSYMTSAYVPVSSSRTNSTSSGVFSSD